jgi:hypothetical protein
MLEDIESMMMRRARLFLPVLAVLLGGAACDPVPPGAAGRITILHEGHVEAGRTLEMRAFPDDGLPFDPASANLLDRDWLLRENFNLSMIEWPYTYVLIGPMGYTDRQKFRLVVWIAESENVDRPLEGEWYGTRLFNLNECGGPFPGYCGVTPEADIEIDRQRP